MESTSTATNNAKGVIEKDIKRYEQMRDDQDQAIETMREEIDGRETLRRKYDDTINVLKRALNRF